MTIIPAVFRSYLTSASHQRQTRTASTFDFRVKKGLYICRPEVLDWRGRGGEVIQLVAPKARTKWHGDKTWRRSLKGHKHPIYLESSQTKDIYNTRCSRLLLFNFICRTP
jgi:hypothetical protein